MKVISGFVAATVLFTTLLLVSTGRAEAKPPWAETTGQYWVVCAYEYCYYSYPDSECYCYNYGFWLSQSFDEDGKAILDPDLSGCEINQLPINRGLIKKLIITARCPDGNKIKIEFSFGRGKKNSLCLLYKGGNVEFTKNNEPYSSCSMASYGGYKGSLSLKAEENNQEESPQTISSLIRLMLSTE